MPKCETTQEPHLLVWSTHCWLNWIHLLSLSVFHMEPTLFTAFHVCFIDTGPKAPETPRQSSSRNFHGTVMSDDITSSTFALYIISDRGWEEELQQLTVYMSISSVSVCSEVHSCSDENQSRALFVKCTHGKRLPTKRRQTFDERKKAKSVQVLWHTDYNTVII